MPRRLNPVPTYRLHKQSGQAVVTLRLPDGVRRDVLLGPYDSDTSKAEYQRVLAEWRTNGGRTVAPPGLTVNEVILAFWKHAEEHYRHPGGTATSELAEYRRSLRPVKELYGHTCATEFGPMALKAIRERMIGAGLCRGVINQRVGRIRRMYKWAVSEELVPHGVYASLATVSGLSRGRTKARETEPVKPVPEAFVEAVLPFVLPPVAAMVELQRLTGARPGEVCTMRGCDIDTSGAVWLYRPRHHKTAWRGKERVIALGPRAQEVIRPLLTLNTGAYLFSPSRALAERAARRRSQRKTPVQPSQQCRRKAKPRKSPGEHYTPLSYAHAIAKACRRAGVPHWHPNQLRHSHATEVRRRFGLEAAGAALGHSKLSASEVYAERDKGLAERVALAIG
jgi:integrase